MKPFYFFLFSFIAFSAFSQTIISAGNVQGNWTSVNSPYIIQGDITVPLGQSLIINPDVQIVFQGLYKLVVDGILDAEGTINQPIVFRVQDTTGWHNDSLPIGGWHGILFNSTSLNDSSTLKFCYIQDTKWGGLVSNLYYALECNRPLTISNCKFFHNLRTQNGWGTLIKVCVGTEMAYCEVSGNDLAYQVVSHWGFGYGPAYIHHNKIHNNKGGSIVFAALCNLLFSENEVYENLIRESANTSISS